MKKHKGLYEGLVTMDVVGAMEPLLCPNGPWYIDSKTFQITVDELVAHHAPWVMIKYPKGLNCRLYFDVFFRQFGHIFKQPPSRCQSCWKVVVKPQTVVQLFTLMELQDRIKDKLYGCKCGMEERHYVNGLYGGYFYNRTKKEGKKCLELVKEEVNKTIGDIPVFLKRACTEMEDKFGDSDKWEVTQDHVRDEIEISQYIKDFEDPKQPQYVKLHIMRRWIEFACKNGDETYLELCNEPLHSTYRKY